MSTSSRTTAEVLLSVDAHLEGIRKAQDAMAHAKREAEATQTMFNRFQNLLAGGSIVGALYSIKNYISGIAEEAGKLVDAADRLGVSLQDLQAIQITAKDFGIDGDAINGALEKLGVNLGKAGNGSDATRSAFARLGLSVEQLMEMDLAHRYEAVAVAFANATDKAEALAAVQEVLGKQGPKQAAYLEDVSKKGIEGLRAETEYLRANELLARKVDDTFDKIGRGWQAIKAQSINAVGAYLMVLSANPSMPGGLLGAISNSGAKVEAKPTGSAAEAKPVVPVATEEQLRAQLELYGPYVKAHKEFADALAMVGLAAETASQKQARLNAEADKLDEQAKGKQSDLRDLAAYAEGETMRAEAQKKRNEAAKIGADLNKKLADLGAKQREQDLAEIANAEQLAARKQDLAALDAKIAGLDRASIDFFEKGLELETERLRIRKEIAALEQKQAAERARASTQAAQDAVRDAQRRSSGITSNPFLTTRERNAQLAPALAAELQTMRDEIDRLRAEAAAQSDDGAKQTLLGQARSIEGQLGGVEARAGALSATSGFGGQLLEQMTTLQNGFTPIAQTITDTIGASIDGIAGSIEGLIMGTMTWGDALRNIGSSVVNEVVASFARMAAQWIVQHTIMAAVSRAISAASLATTAPIAVAHAALWSPAATLATIATFGAAAAQAPATMGGALALGQAQALIAGVSGFSSGGFTGYGGVNEIAGFAHRGEVIFSQADVARWGGVEAVESLRLGGVSGVGVSGVVADSGTSASGRTQRVILVDDRNVAARLAEDPEFDSHIVSVNDRNRFRS